MTVGWTSLLEKQKTAATILTNGVKKSQLSHAYLFEGPRGTGKMAAAMTLAKTYFCTKRQSVNPCDHCRDCKRIDHGNHPDVLVISPDGRSIKKEQVAGLIKEFSYKAVESRKKVFIVEHAGIMTTQAANSLLKFIEEPQSEQMAILLTENPHQLLDTIVSRCQMIRFLPLSKNEVMEHLTEKGYKSELARLSSAITHDLDEAEALCRDEWFARARTIVINLMEELLLRPKYAFMVVYEQFTDHFTDIKKSQMALDLMLMWYRDVMSVHLDNEGDIRFGNSADLIQKQALNTTLDSVTNQISAVLDAKKRMDANVAPLQVFEQLVLAVTWR